MTAFVQGAAVGAMIRSIPVKDGQFAGGVFDWLAPLSVLTGIGQALGYALLGAGWIVLKSDGELREWARQRIPWLALALLVVLVVAFDAALWNRERIQKVAVAAGYVSPAVPAEIRRAKIAILGLEEDAGGK